MTRRRSETAVAEDGRVRRPRPNQPGGASPKSPRWDNQIPCLVPHTGKGASVVRGLVSTRRGSEESGTNAPFWPEACATRLQHAAPFGSWLQGPGVNLQRATAMKPWKTSSATNETRSACPSFALIRNGLAMGQYYQRARRENRKLVLTPRSRPVILILARDPLAPPMVAASDYLPRA